MNVWARIIPVLDTDSDANSMDVSDLRVTAGLCVTAYFSEALAREEQERKGGIVLQIVAAGLSECSEFPEISLTAHDDNECKAPSTAFISVSYAGLPYKMVPNIDPSDPAGTEPQGEIADFGAEAVAWLDALEQEIGMALSQ